MSDANSQQNLSGQRQPSYDELTALVVQLLEESRQLRAENERLRAEVGFVCAENARVCAENEQLRAEVGFVCAENERLRGENARLAGRVAELQAQRQRGQKRSAAPFSKNQPKANPKRPGRKKGEGKFEFRRAPMPTEPPVIVPMPTVCPACGAAAELLQPVAFELPTITELPQPKPRVTQYRRPLCRCGRCGNDVRGEHADLAADQIGASAHRFGPRAKAAALILNAVHGVPINHVPAILRTLTGVEMTPATVTHIAQQAVAQDGPLAAVIDEIAAEIASSHLAYMDATGWHIAGEAAQLVGVEGRNAAGEPTNNVAERSLRPAVIARKVSQCSRSLRGAKTYARLKTVLETWRRRDRDLLVELTRYLSPNRPAPAR